MQRCFNPNIRKMAKTNGVTPPRVGVLESRESSSRSPQFKYKSNLFAEAFGLFVYNVGEMDEFEIFSKDFYLTLQVG